MISLISNSVHLNIDSIVIVFVRLHFHDPFTQWGK